MGKASFMIQSIRSLETQIEKQFYESCRTEITRNVLENKIHYNYWTEMTQYESDIGSSYRPSRCLSLIATVLRVVSTYNAHFLHRIAASQKSYTDHKGYKANDPCIITKKPYI